MKDESEISMDWELEMVKLKAIGPRMEAVFNDAVIAFASCLIPAFNNIAARAMEEIQEAFVVPSNSISRRCSEPTLGKIKDKDHQSNIMPAIGRYGRCLSR
jgi:hypothetical protein